ncbi:MAG: hypothetical protein H6860_02455 [Rhodospirillales bacterium]|nr:hypothetical protein [Rhodospirillales bacterium]
MRYEHDRFQILSGKLGDAITNYFAGAHPATVLDLAHSCSAIIRDLAHHLHKEGHIHKLELWSDMVERLSGQSLFHYKRINGNQGLYVRIANQLKHADRDTEAFVGVSDHFAFEYLYATVKDFQVLKESLEPCDIFGSYESDRYGPHFMRAAFHPLQKLKSFASMRDEAKVDLLTNAFLQWHGYLEKRISEQFPRLKSDFYDVSGMPEIGVLNRLGLYKECNDVMHAYCVRAGSLLLRRGWSSEDVSPEQMRDLRHAMRYNTRNYLFDFAIKPRGYRKNYYLKFDSSVPGHDVFSTTVIRSCGLDAAKKIEPQSFH